MGDPLFSRRTDETPRSEGFKLRPLVAKAETCGLWRERLPGSAAGWRASLVCLGHSRDQRRDGLAASPEVDFRPSDHLVMRVRHDQRGSCRQYRTPCPTDTGICEKGPDLQQRAPPDTKAVGVEPQEQEHRWAVGRGRQPVPGLDRG